MSGDFWAYFAANLLVSIGVILVGRFDDPWTMLVGSVFIGSGLGLMVRLVKQGR